MLQQTEEKKKGKGLLTFKHQKTEPQFTSLCHSASSYIRSKPYFLPLILILRSLWNQSKKIKDANKDIGSIPACRYCDQGVLRCRTKDDLTNATFNVTTCIDALRCLKSLSLSAEDLVGSSVLQKLERLRDHRNPKIRTEVRSLLCTWMRTLYAKSVPTTVSPRCCVSKRVSLKNHNGERCETAIAVSENETQLLEMFEVAKKAADVANAKGILLGKSEASRCVDVLSKLMTLTVTRRILEENRIEQRLEHLTKHKNRKICSSAVLLLQHWKESTVNQECQASVTKLKSDLLFASGRIGACKAVPKRSSEKKKLQQQHQPVEVSAKPRGSIIKSIENNGERSMRQADILKNAVELLELFEAAKKAADAANAKGILLGQSEASRCVGCLSKLTRVPVNWEVVKAHGMERRLEHLTKHKDRKICSSATALLQHWRQSTGRQECRDSATTMKNPYVPKLVAAV